MSDYYVYALLDPRKPSTGPFSYVPKYIGKGRGPRAKVSAFLEAKYMDSPKTSWVRRLRREGYEPILTFIRRRLPEAKAFALEKKLINDIGLKQDGEGPLLNRSHGGEGGGRFSSARQARYCQMLAAKAPGFSLVEGVVLHGIQGYVEHVCSVHGVVTTAPAHVAHRLRCGRPPCPKCGTKARGPKMREHRLRYGRESYQAVWKDIDPTEYKVLGEYQSAGKHLKHWCKYHGNFSVTPTNARSKILSGLTPCPECNQTNKVFVDPHVDKRARQLTELAAKVKIAPGRYRLLTKTVEEFSSRKVALRLKCPKHGEFTRKHGYLVKSLDSGRSPCPHCNLEERNRQNGLR